MAAGVYNFHCEQGADFDRTIYARDSAGALINLTGKTGRMHVRKDVDAAAVIIELTTSNGRMIFGGAAGTVRLLLPAATTATLTKSGVYDIELVDTGSGAVTRLLKGEFILDKNVTR